MNRKPRTKQGTKKVSNNPSSDGSPASPNPSFEGMGAIVLPQGVGFRVWAPHAERVCVVGSFNDWNTTKHPLHRGDNDTWQVVVENASPGDEYQFVLMRDGQELWRTDPRARKVKNSASNGIICPPPPSQEEGATTDPTFTPPTLDQLILYELHIGSFNAVSGDDGVAQRPGTFDSAIEKLPYLRNLGVNAVELMPVAEFAGDFSWGYNPAHPFAVESAYGGPDGLRTFVRAAHDHGIAVILDVVYNHFGPSDLSLWQFDGWNENGLGGIYFYNDWRSTTPWGDTRPDYGRGEVRTYIHDNALMWMHDFGVDGLRWDMTVFIRSYRGNAGAGDDDLKEGWGLMQWLNDSIHSEFPGAITIAEDLRNSEWLVKGTGAGGAGFSSQWDAAFVHPVRAALATHDDQQRHLNDIISALKNSFDNDAFKRVVYSESHDEVANGKARLPTEIDAADPNGYPARKRAALGAGLVLTAPGVPMLFQGQEFLEVEWFRDSVPVKWDRLERHAGTHALYRDLIALRRNFAGNTAGLSGPNIETHHVDHERKILAYHRWRDGGPGDDVIVVLNLSYQPVSDIAIGVPASGVWHVRLNSDGRAYGDDYADLQAASMEAWGEPRDGYAQHVVMAVGPWSQLILSQDRPTQA